MGNGWIGLGTDLAIVFVVLRLCGVIGWSWLWVLSPVWVPAAVALAAYGIYLGLTTKEDRELDRLKRDIARLQRR